MLVLNYGNVTRNRKPYRISRLTWYDLVLARNTNVECIYRPGCSDLFEASNVASSNEYFEIVLLVVSEFSICNNFSTAAIRRYQYYALTLNIKKELYPACQCENESKSSYFYKCVYKILKILLRIWMLFTVSQYADWDNIKNRTNF